MGRRDKTSSSTQSS